MSVCKHVISSYIFCHNQLIEQSTRSNLCQSWPNYRLYLSTSLPMRMIRNYIYLHQCQCAWSTDTLSTKIKTPGKTLVNVDIRNAFINQAFHLPDFIPNHIAYLNTYIVVGLVCVPDTGDTVLLVATRTKIDLTSHP